MAKQVRDLVNCRTLHELGGDNHMPISLTIRRVARVCAPCDELVDEYLSSGGYPQ